MKIFAEIVPIEKDISKNFKIETATVNEAKDKLAIEESNWLGVGHKKIIHYCHHDEKNNQPCEIQEIV